MYKESIYNLDIKRDEGKVLLYNTKYRSLGWIEEEIYKQFNHTNHIRDERVLDELLKCHFIVDSATDESESIMKEYRKIVFDKKSSSVTFVIASTMRCNYRCVYCFEKKSGNSQQMNEKTIEEVIAYIKNQVVNNKIKNLHIQWFGGEPLLNIDIIEKISIEIISFCEEKNISYRSNIITNGYLLTDTIAKQLKKYKVDKIQITIDGMPTTYSLLKGCSKEAFYTVANNLTKVCDIIDVIIRINVGRDNLAEIKELLIYLLVQCKLVGKVKVYFAQIREYTHEIEGKGLSRAEYVECENELFHFMIENGLTSSIMCNLPSTRFIPCGSVNGCSRTIDPEGQIYCCEHLLGMKNMHLGKISDSLKGEEEIDPGIYKQYCSTERIEKCLTCAIFPTCFGGCIANNIVHDLEMDCDAEIEYVINRVYIHYLVRNLLKGSIQENVDDIC